jgi:RHS repeat-associated protein
VHHQRGNIRQINDYYPYGLTWSKPEGAKAQMYQSKQWEQDEWSTSGLDMYDFHARMYDPVLGRWHAPDPMNQYDSPYTAMGNNPVTTIDPDGMLGIPWGAIISALGTAIQKQGVSWVVNSRDQSLTPIGGTFGKIVSAIGGAVAFGEGGAILNAGQKQLALNWGNPVWLKTATFIVQHPVAAASIGIPNLASGSNNISTNSVRFSNSLGLIDTRSNKLTQVNAYRHTLWQAIITEEFGFSIAAEIGYAHEPDDYIINTLNGSSSYTFSGDDAIDKADSAADQLNNVIGRTIGGANKDSTPKQLAERILDYYHSTGLWEGHETFDGQGNSTGFVVERVKLTTEQYNAAKEKLKGLNDQNGFDQKLWEESERKAREQAIKETQDALQQKF